LKRIKKIGVVQTAKVVGILYALLSAVILVPMGIIMIVSGANGNPIGAWLTLLGPIFYGLITFVMIAILSLVYNFISKKIGGIEIELE